MAQQEKQVDWKSLWVQGLQAKTPQQKESCVVLLAKDLSIASGSNYDCWRWTLVPGPNCTDAFTVVELLQVCCLQINGKYPGQNLKKGQKYEVDLIVELKNKVVMNGPVTLKLTCPDGSTHDHQEDLTKKPMYKWVGLKVGEFNNTTCPCGRNADKDVEFSLNGCDDTTLKKGLTVIGAIIWAI